MLQKIKLFFYLLLRRVLGPFLRFAWFKRLVMIGKANLPPPPITAPIHLQEVLVSDKKLKLYYSNEEDILKWRYDTFYTKEPETLEWIDSFRENTVFWDIGANVGIYSLYAAVRRKAKVYAFEPNFVNYYYLSAHIVNNGLDGDIAAFPIALCESTGIAKFQMSSLAPGGAEAHFGEKVDRMPFYSKQEVKFRQAVIGFTIDDFIAKFPESSPHHIKIDVDGIEADIVKGANKTLGSSRLKSLQIELDEKDSALIQRLDSLLSGYSFKLFSKRHASMFDNSAYSSVFNYVFAR